MLIPAFVSESCGPKQTVVQRLDNSMHVVKMQFSEFSTFDKSRIWLVSCRTEPLHTDPDSVRGKALHVAVMGSQFLLFGMTVAPQVQNGSVPGSFESCQFC